MEILLYILLGLLLIIGIVVAVYILFQLFIKVFSYVVGIFIISVAICGLAMVINLCQKGTIFGNGMSFSEGIHYILDTSKVSPKVSKGDLSVKEIEAPKQVDAPHQIEGAKEVKK